MVTHHTVVREVPGSFPGSDKHFLNVLFVLLLLCFYVFVQNTVFVMKFLHFLIAITRVSRYRIRIVNGLVICVQIVFCATTVYTGTLC